MVLFYPIRAIIFTSLVIDDEGRFAVSTPLLVTKLYFPAPRPTLVARPRLLQRLNVGLRGRLTLIAAPAGYGKTMLMGEWRAISGNQMPAAWLSLDSNDNNLFTFLTYLTAALDSLQEGLCANTRFLLQSEQPLPTAFLLTTLINDLDRYHTDFVMALDDCHVITDPEIHSALDFLVCNQPPQMHLVLLSRSDPELPLGRLRARGQMVEIRAVHLRFNVDEVAQFLIQVMGLDLTQQQVADLEAHSEGWIAGLQLAALAMQAALSTPGTSSMQECDKDMLSEFIEDFTGSHRYIVDYLVDEVLVNRPEEQRDFLLKTSILERLNASLCDALTNRNNSQEILQTLESANLFLIPLDDQRGWYRYHHLFADVLRNRLKFELPDQVDGLHRCAAESLIQNGLMVEAIEHAFMIEDYDFVRDLLRRSYAFLIRTENRATVKRFFERIPWTYLQSEPWLCVMNAWILWNEGKLHPTEDLLTCAQKAYQQLYAKNKLPKGDPAYDGLPAEILAFEALIHTQKGQPDKVIHLAEQALAIAPQESADTSAVALLAQQVACRQKGQMDIAIESCLRALPLSRVTQDIGTRVSVLHSLGVGLMIQGELSQLIRVYEDGLQFAEARGEIDHPRYDLIYFKLADVAYIRNDLDRVDALLKQGFKRSEQNTNLWPRFYGKMLQMQWLLARGDQREAKILQNEMEGVLEKVHGAYFEEELNAYVIMMKVFIGNLEGVRTWVKSYQNVIHDPLDYAQLEPALQLAFTLEALDEIDQAIQLAKQIEAITAKANCRHLQIYALVLLAKGWVKKGQLPEAQKALTLALQLGQPEGYMRVFLDQGKIMQEQLKLVDTARLKEPLDLYLRQLLGAFEKVHAVPSKPGHPFMAALSARELEVLGLIAAGCTNKEIGNELVIAIGTVKRHTVNIFTKLDVKNRTEAVAKAREVGIL
jgi:LuxR family maltose regulon positive regulatory protein